MKHLLFIFNPISGKARIKYQLFDIVNYYTQNDYLVTVVPTQHKNHLYEIIQDLPHNYDKIVCCGGDGTLNETISALMDMEISIDLGYIPSGSTNDFARTLGISCEIEKSLPLSIYGHPCKIDIGQLNEKYFVYVAAFGLFTSVSYSTPQKYKNMLGYIAYILEGIRQISELKSYHIQLNYENGIIEDDFMIGFVTNSLSIAGFKNPTSHDVSLNDGMFEVLLIKKPNNILEIQTIIASVLSENINTNFITYFQSSNLSIHSDHIQWTLDGEYGGNYQNVCIKNLQQKLSIMGEYQ